MKISLLKGLLISSSVLVVSSFALLVPSCILAQEVVSSPNPFYIEPEVTLGKLANAYTGFPEAGMKTTASLSFGFANTNKLSWARYFNYPQTGLITSFSSLGNKQYLGYEVSVLPYVLFNPAKRMKQPFFIKLALGASYFTKHYDAVKNPENKAIGSSFNWAFQWFAYQSVAMGQRYNIKVGLGWNHSSSGHVSLPNFGYNSFSFGIATQVFPRQNGPLYGRVRGKLVEEKLPLRGIMTVRHCAGLHQMGGTGPAANRSLHSIYTSAISGGVLIHGFVKVSVGAAYRFYSGFYDRILEMPESKYAAAPILNASNVNLFLTTEFLLGHFGLDLEVGFNAYKPFYRQFYDDYEPKNGGGFSYRSKLISTQRIGLNAYLFSVKKNPTHNLCLGAHINANFGQADFSDLSLAYSVTMKRRKKETAS